jgi:RNA polymerase sigma factor (sigma-70 family)
MSAVSGDQQQQAVVTGGSRGLLPVPRALLRMRSDSALAERVTGGDESAFDVLYERHRAVVLAVAMGVLGTSHDAEDATQETFSALAVALRTKPPAELRPWLIRVARNAAIDTTRRRRHRLLTLDGEIPEVQARPTGGGKAELAVVFDGIRELPEGQRMALLMRELGGHSYAEIADFLETDEEAVKGLIARARVGLRAFREASELSCTSARTTIAAEPDGRRYDKTIRRHLRACASCRSYRDALRDDAKALRAALPLQAGGDATGTGIGAGPLAAAKGAMIGYSLTQAAAACAASACAVGAVGGMVLIGPVHGIGIPAILPIAKHAQVHRTDAKLASAHKHVKVATHPLILAHTSYSVASYPAVATSEPVRHAAAVAHAIAKSERRRHEHHRLAVKRSAVHHTTAHRSTVHLKVTPATTTTALPTVSEPTTLTSTPAQPVQPQPATSAPVQTPAAAAAPTQTTSAAPSATPSSGTTQTSASNPTVTSSSTPATDAGSSAPSSVVSSTTTTPSTTTTTPSSGWHNGAPSHSWTNPSSTDTGTTTTPTTTTSTSPTTTSTTPTATDTTSSPDSTTSPDTTTSSSVTDTPTGTTTTSTDTATPTTARPTSDTTTGSSVIETSTDSSPTDTTPTDTDTTTSSWASPASYGDVTQSS